MAYYHMKDLPFMPGFIHLLPGLFSQEFVAWIGFVGGVCLEHVYFSPWCSTTSFGSSVFLRFVLACSKINHQINQDLYKLVGLSKEFGHDFACTVWFMFNAAHGCLPSTCFCWRFFSLLGTAILHFPKVRYVIVPWRISPSWLSENFAGRLRHPPNHHTRCLKAWRWSPSATSLGYFRFFWCTEGLRLGLLFEWFLVM